MSHVRMLIDDTFATATYTVPIVSGWIAPPEGIAVENLQMTKIESRPSKGWLGDYVFLIDFEGHRQDERVARVLENIRDRSSILKIFGSYPRFPLESLRDAIDPVQPID